MRQRPNIYFSMPESSIPYSTNYNNAITMKSVVRDYNVLQGTTHPSDLTIQPIRDINMRQVSIQNSSPINYVGIAITSSPDMYPTPPIKFYLQPGEIRPLGINTIGEKMQYIHMLNPKTNLYLGNPYEFRTDANQFVLREGINKWFVQPFRTPSYNAAH